MHTPEDKYRVGAIANSIDRHDKLMMTITDSLENEKITYRTSYFFVHCIDPTYVLELVEKRTKLTYVISYEMIGWGILGKILVKLMTMASERKGDREIAREVEKHSGEIDAHQNSNLLRYVDSNF